MTHPPYEARTAYGVTIPKALHTRSAALLWAQQEGRYFPGSRVVMRTKTGIRTIWKHVEEAA